MINNIHYLSILLSVCELRAVMALNTSDVIDLSKENIQPLKQGRKAAQLKTALQAQNDPETYQQLIKQREKFEYAIRMYNGDDPLDPYYNYVIWLEQSFPTIGRENNLILLLEDILLKFKDCEKYKQDPRLIQLLIKYINLQSNPLELYQIVYNQGLGTMRSMFYKAWAEELDKTNDYKRADQVFQLGLRCHAQPLNELEEAHIQFQLSIARRLLEGTMTESVPMTEPSRTVLSKLQPSKVKSSRLSKSSAGTLQLLSNGSDLKGSNFRSAKFKVYQEDEPDEYFKSEFKNELEKFPRGSITARENVMKPGKWSGQKHKQSSAFRTSTSSITSSFQIHEDPEAVCETIKTVTRPCALKVKKAEFKCPVAIFGPADPTKKPMYPKQMVYVGGRDIQLEEIRAAYYWKKIEEMERKQDNHNENNGTNSSEETVDRVQCITSVESKLIKNNASSSSFSGSETAVWRQSTSSKLSLNPESNCFDESISMKSDSKHSVTAQHTVIRETEKSVKPDNFFTNENAIYAENDNPHLLTPHNAPSESAQHFGPAFSNKNDVPQLFSKTEKPVTSSNFIQPIYTTCIRPKQISTSDLFEDEKPAFEQNNIFRKPYDIPPINPGKSVISTNVFREEQSNTEANVKNTFQFSPDKNENRNHEKNGSDKNFDKSMSFFSDPFDDVASDKIRKNKDDILSFSISEPSTSNMSMFHHSPSTSMTVNTRAAMNVIQQMWESPLAQSSRRTGHSIRVNSGKQPFSVYCEESLPQIKDKLKECNDDLPRVQKNKNTAQVQSTKLPFTVYCEETISKMNDKQQERVDDLCDFAKIENNPWVKSDNYPFPIFCEDSLLKTSEKQPENIDDLLDKPGSKLIFDKNRDRPLSSLKLVEESEKPHDTPVSVPLIIPVNLHDTPLEPHNKENRPPTKYSSPEENKLFRVPYMRINDDNESMVYAKNIEFIDETCNTNAFKIVLPSSTPRSREEQLKSSRKSYLHNGSYLSEDNLSLGYVKFDQKSFPSNQNAGTSRKTNKNATDLSLILENSKEQGNSSSSNSGNASSK